MSNPKITSAGRLILSILALTVLLAVVSCQSVPGGDWSHVKTPKAVILKSSAASALETLAAKEIRRYLYLRTGELVPVVDEVCEQYTCDMIIVGSKEQGCIQTILKNKNFRSSVETLGAQEYRIKTVEQDNRRVLLVVGGDEVGTLYAAYRFAELLGVGFYLDGDVVPDERIAFAVPEIDEVGRPLFNLRGIQPFHDFPEGPDWWNVDDYKAYISQLPKMGMNFIGLHTYPQGAGPEPTTWVGLVGDLGSGTEVKNAYPSGYQNTLRGNWGYAAKKTGDFNFGASELFERDDYGSDVMIGLCPWSKGDEQNREIYKRTADLLNDAFSHARKLGVKTCIGTETPLTVPTLLKERLDSMGLSITDPGVVQHLYEGVFWRIAQSHPLDYYWLWTPEGWTWAGTSDEQVAATQRDILLAVEAAKKVDAPFTLATAGWVLGPTKDRALFDRVLPKEMPFSCINREVGKEPVEEQFNEIKGRPKWAIPWLEDDPGMISLQLWVGRMRKDALDAYQYGCTGLMGIHWRTRILGPNVSALAKAGWDQSWASEADKPRPGQLLVGALGGLLRDYAGEVEGADEDRIYQQSRYRFNGYNLKVPNGTYAVTMKFNEPHYKQAGKRKFDVKLQGEIVKAGLDIFAEVGRDHALDYTFEDTRVDDGVLKIEFVQDSEDAPVISAIIIDGTADAANQFEARPWSLKMNCGGEAYGDYAADIVADKGPRHLASGDFYLEWARHSFGEEVAQAAAKIFETIDGKTPEPSKWIDGPGGIATNNDSWQNVSKAYLFVDEFAALAGSVKGRGNRDRFDYWLNNLQFFKEMAHVGCTLGELDGAMKKVGAEQDAERKKQLARQVALPIRLELVRNWGVMVGHLLATVSTPGEMGTVANLEQHSIEQLKLLRKHDEALAAALGEELPAKAGPSKEYAGAGRIIVPTVRTNLDCGEEFRLKVILPGIEPRDAKLYWRSMGCGKFAKVSLKHVSRSVYSVKLPSKAIKGDFEYFIKVRGEQEQVLHFPATAPELNQTVLVSR